MAVESVTEVLADPAVTTAVAEVTAYVCHALEMEAEARTRHPGRRQRAAAAARVGSGLTVEERILQSLDPLLVAQEEDGSITMEWDKASASIRQQVEGSQETGRHGVDEDDEEEDIVVQAREEVDVEYLREHIEDRALRLRRDGEWEKREDIELRDVEQEPNLYTRPQNKTRGRISVETVEQDELSDSDVKTEKETYQIPNHLRSESPGRLDGESNLEQFDRVVNEILAKQRISRPAVTSRQKPGFVRRPGVHTELLQGGIATARSLLERKQKNQSRRSSLVLLVGGVVLALTSTFWFGMGCYGAYHFLIYNSNVQLQSPIQFSPVRGRAGEEIVIRVVKEIVHKDTNGRILASKFGDDGNSQFNQRVVECIAAGLEEI